MKEELNHITNIQILNNNQNTITYEEKNEKGELVEKIVSITFDKPLEKWDIIYDKIINRVYELGILNRVNSDLSINSIPINKDDSNSLHLLYENIEEIIKYLLSSNDKNMNNSFLIMNEELYNVMSSILDNNTPYINYHKNNNIGNDVIIGIKNDYDETGINVYMNNQRE